MVDTPIPNQPYSLSILFSADGFSFTIFDEFNYPLSTRKIYASMTSLSSEQIGEVLKQQEELNVNYTTVQLICESDLYTVIPSAFFRPEEAKNYLQFQHELPTYETVIYNEIAECSVVSIFSIPKALKAALEMSYPTLQPQHQLSSILGLKTQMEAPLMMHVWMRFKKLDIVLFNNANLQLANCYPYNSPEDAVYYILNVFDKLQLDAQSCDLSISNLSMCPELEPLMKSYVKAVNTI